MQPGIFRPVALERMSSPERLDRLLRVADPQTWIALLALAFLTLGVIGWSIFGIVATTVSAQGVVIRQGGTYDVSALQTGFVKDVRVRRGDVLREGQVIATLAQPGGATFQTTNPFSSARVLEVLVSKEEPVTADKSVISVELLDEEIVALFYLPATVAAQVQPGMAARISPSSVKREEVGFILGQVRSVAQFPATRRGLMALLQNDSLVQLFLSSTRGAPVEVEVQLQRDRTPTGFKWSSGQGPPDADAIDSGTLSAAEIVLTEQRPISLVLPLGQ